MIDSVEAVLHEIGADEVPVELVLNKIDLVDPLGRRRLANRFPGALQVAAATGEGLDELRERIAERFAEPLRGRPAAAAVRPGCEARRAVRARRADRGAGGRQRKACSCAPGCPAARSRGSRRSSWPTPRIGVREAENDVIQLDDHPPPRGRDHSRARLRRRRRSRPGRASSPPCSARGRGRRSAPGSRSRSPRATPPSSSRAPASPPSTGSRSSTHPG